MLLDLLVTIDAPCTLLAVVIQNLPAGMIVSASLLIHFYNITYVALDSWITVIEIKRQLLD